METTKKPSSSYFLFCNDKRADVLKKNPGIRVGSIAKIMSKKWKALSADERKRYETIASEAKKEYALKLACNPDLDKVKSKAHYDPDSISYPITRVKKIVKQDGNIQKLSNEALMAIAKATEMFAQLLATKSYKQTLHRQKQQIKPVDIHDAIHSDKVFDWLREDFPKDLDEKHTKKKTKFSPVSSNTKVTEFFSSSTSSR